VPGDASSSPSARSDFGAPRGGEGSSSTDGASASSLTIDTIQRKGATGEAVRIQLSDGSFFVLHAEIFARTSLRAGSPIDPETRDDLLARSEHVLARIRALSLLSRAAQTRQGLTRKLQARGFSAPAVRYALARVTEMGYLNDREFADAWLRSRLAARRDGWTALRRGLMARGVARAVAEEALEEMYPGEAEVEVARDLVEGLSRDASIRKLSGKGFRSRTIAAVIRARAGAWRESSAE
jgi:regulatory protein